MFLELCATACLAVFIYMVLQYFFQYLVQRRIRSCLSDDKDTPNHERDVHTHGVDEDDPFSEFELE
jgi:hypothetical protein